MTTTTKHTYNINGNEAHIWLDYGVQCVHASGIMFDEDARIIAEYDGPDRFIGLCAGCIICRVAMVMDTGNYVCDALDCSCTCDD